MAPYSNQLELNRVTSRESTSKLQTHHSGERERREYSVAGGSGAARRQPSAATPVTMAPAAAGSPNQGAAGPHPVAAAHADRASDQTFPTKNGSAAVPDDRTTRSQPPSVKASNGVITSKSVDRQAERSRVMCMRATITELAAASDPLTKWTTFDWLHIGNGADCCPHI